MAVLHVLLYNFRFCGDYYSGSQLNSTKNTMTLVFESWYNYNHWTGFSASYIVTASSKYKTGFSAPYLLTGSEWQPAGFSALMLLLVVSVGLDSLHPCHWYWSVADCIFFFLPCCWSKKQEHDTLSRSA